MRDRASPMQPWCSQFFAGIFYISFLVGCNQPSPPSSDSVVLSPAASANSHNEPRTLNLEQIDPSGLAQRFQADVTSIFEGQARSAPALLNVAIEGATADLTGGDFSSEAFNRAIGQWSVTSVENGKVRWKGKTLPAAVVKIEVDTINRAEGTYDYLCIEFAGIADSEFDVIRSSQYGYCDQEQQFLTWRSENGFTSIHSFSSIRSQEITR